MKNLRDSRKFSSYWLNHVINMLCSDRNGAGNGLQFDLGRSFLRIFGL